METQHNTGKDINSHSHSFENQSWHQPSKEERPLSTCTDIWEDKICE